MAKGGIRVGAVPGENGDAIDNKITGSDEPTADSGEDTENE
jgi:hypothetical protein